jgi:hypothetical protein
MVYFWHIVLLADVFAVGSQLWSHTLKLVANNIIINHFFTPAGAM